MKHNQVQWFFSNLSIVQYHSKRADLYVTIGNEGSFRKLFSFCTFHDIHEICGNWVKSKLIPVYASTVFNSNTAFLNSFELVTLGVNIIIKNKNNTMFMYKAICLGLTVFELNGKFDVILYLFELSSEFPKTEGRDIVVNRGLPAKQTVSKVGASNEICVEYFPLFTLFSLFFFLFTYYNFYLFFPYLFLSVGQ